MAAKQVSIAISHCSHLCNRHTVLQDHKILEPATFNTAGSKVGYTRYGEVVTWTIQRVSVICHTLMQVLPLPRKLSPYSDLLRTGRSGIRIPVTARFSTAVQTNPRPIHPRLIPRIKKQQGYTDMRRLTMGIGSEKCVVRRFRRCAPCTYANIVQYSILHT